MKMETIPDISIPYLMVMGVYPGATPEQVMDDVSIPLEKAVENLEDVKVRLFKFLFQYVQYSSGI